MNNKTNRGNQIEKVINDILPENIFNTHNEFKTLLQDELNKQLSFKTLVLDIETINKFTVGKIQFKNENEIDSVIEFTITYNNETIEVYE